MEAGKDEIQPHRNPDKDLARRGSVSQRPRRLLYNHESKPFGIQWMRYGNKCTLPKIVKEIAHIAFEVDDLRKAIEGREVLIDPNSPSKGVTVAFVLEDGAPVELLEFEKPQQSGGG